jgi:3',5'-cyclic AMP phosphodiesterase CpdA
MRVDAKPVAPEQQALLSNSANIAAISALDAPANGSFSFIVIGDNRGGDKVFLRLIAQVNEYVAQHQGAERPLFALHTGDAVPSGKRVEWEHYARMRAALDIPMVQVRGNHEIKTAEGPKNYVGLVGPLNWVFDFSGCRFIGLDNATMRFSEASVEFLRRQLGAGQAGHVFVAFHEPPNTGRWAVHSMVSDGAGGRGGEVLAALKQGGVSAAFLGHIHLYDELELGGVQYIISGGGGAPLYTKYGFGKPEYGFLAVHVAPKQVSWDWVAHAK